MGGDPPSIYSTLADDTQLRFRFPSYRQLRIEVMDNSPDISTSLVRGDDSGVVDRG
jgi:hypothetical protein